MLSIILSFCIQLSSGIEQTDSLSGIRNLSGDVLQTDEVDHLGRGAVLINWQAISKASYYKVFISRDKEFLQQREIKTYRSQLTFVGFAGAPYYWRVVAYHKNGQRLSGLSKTPFSFVIAPSPQL